jgi:hypothetical protein
MFKDIEEKIKQLFKIHSTLPKSTLFQKPLEEINQFEKKFHYFSLQPLIGIVRPLIGRITDHQESIKVIQKVLYSIHEKVHHPLERSIVTAEMLTKVLAYRDLEKGDKIQIPWIGKNQELKLYSYQVNTVFNLSNGMPAFGLIPHEKEAHPILLYRGTDFTLRTKRGLASLKADLDISGPGYNTFLKARPIIKEWLIFAKKNYQPAAVMGYSLGGILTTYTLLFEKDLISWDPLFASFAFHPPGLSKNLYKKWVEEKRPPLFVYYHKNDFVSKIGRHVGEVHEVTLEKPLIGVMAHTSLICSKTWKNFSFKKV